MAKLLTKDMTLVVNTLDDDLLSSAGDVAVIDVSDLKNISIYLNHRLDDADVIGRLKAELDLAVPGSATLNTVIEATSAGTGGNSLTFRTLTGGPAGGTLSRIGNAFTYTYSDGVTTVADLEADINALAGADDLIAVKTPGTGGNVLADPADTFGATALAGGTDGEGNFTLVVEKSVDGVNFAALATLDQTDFPDGADVAKEITLSDANGMPVLAKQIRATLSVLEDSSKFSVVAAGVQN